jgi:hypothetical protein
VGQTGTKTKRPSLSWIKVIHAVAPKVKICRWRLEVLKDKSKSYLVKSSMASSRDGLA